LPDRADVANLLAAQAITRLMELGEWESLKQSLGREDQRGAVAKIDRALDSLDIDEVASLAHLDTQEVAASLDERTRNDAIYRVLDLAGTKERPLLSTVLGIRSAETVGKNLARATEDLTRATQTAGENLTEATRNLTVATWRVGLDLGKATWSLVIASGALVIATVILVIITALKG
jgi:hypothetical protein